MSTGSHTMSPPMSPGMTTIGAPKYGTVVPNRIFVGGISPQTTEEELYTLFSNYGSVKDTKIIIDRAGVSKGYGFVTFENDEEAKKLQTEGDSIVFKDRKLNIAPAVIKQADAECDGLFPLDPLLGCISECFIRRCKSSIVKVFEFEAMCQLEAALKRMDFTQLVRSYGRRYLSSVTGAVTSLP